MCAGRGRSFLFLGPRYLRDGKRSGGRVLGCSGLSHAPSGLRVGGGRGEPSYGRLGLAEPGDEGIRGFCK